MWSILFPPICPLCGQALRGQEDGVCDECLKDQPLTWMEVEEHPNHIESLFIGNFPIVSGYALWSYKKESRYHTLAYSKYRGNPRLAESLGRIAGHKIQELSLFSDVDYILPMPMHWLRWWMRGFNQAEKIASGVSEVIKIPVDTGHLVKERYNARQASLRGDERRKNVRNVYGVRHPEELAGKHVLLLDDVCTTGSTLYSAVEALRDEVQDVQISIFTLYFAHS